MSDVAQEIKVGDAAADFTLKDQDQNDVTPSSFKGQKKCRVSVLSLGLEPSL